MCFVQEFPNWFEWNRDSLTVTADHKLSINPDYVLVSRLRFCEHCGVCLMIGRHTRLHAQACCAAVVDAFAVRAAAAAANTSKL